jgi:Beta propeller domain
MTGRFPLTAVAALAAGVLLTAGCTGDPKPAQPTGAPRATGAPAGAFRLVAFNTCQDALADLKRAAKAYVGPYGLGGPDGFAAGASRAMTAESRAGAADAAAPKAAEPAAGTDYSGTNTHEAGVDEPDLVKTDGRRIVTITQGVLRVVDPATRKVTGRLDLTADGQDPIRWSSPDLLLSGDRALVLARADDYRAMRDVFVPQGKPVVPPADPDRIAGPRLLLVDLSGSPRLLSSYTIDGGLVDARQVGATARVVVRSTPRLRFPYAERATDAQRLAANKAVIDKSSLQDWLPEYAVTTDGRTQRGRVDCGSVSRPEKYSGTSMMTLLTFDLGAGKLGDGQPVTVVADGETVYSNGPSLYVANDERWRAVPFEGSGQTTQPREVSTEIYKFDTSGSDRPRYVAAGSVPGYLINQYALSEWDGHLRVATTGMRSRQSTVYVLRQDGKNLAQTGKVGGLGKGERIYAVRFVGPVGYVVTFRQTDPLYTVDLSDPAKPTVTGELKITGYSAYLHPAGDGRLIGIGQEASNQGRIQGTQISLFDVSDLNHPGRLAQYHVKNSNSEAEYDPHAFLYWPADQLLVVPLTVYQTTTGGTADSKTPPGAALVLRVGDNKLTEVGMVTQQADMIRRALVVDGVLWTASDSGLQATNMSTLDKLAWVPLN